jgi:hypothetical protein
MSDGERMRLPQVRINKAAGGYGETGQAGLNTSGGLVQEEFLPGLHGRKAIEAYKDMSTNDPVVWAILFAIKMLIRQVEWRVDPPEDDPDDNSKAAEFLDGCMQDMSHTWEDMINEILTMLVYGWSFHEIVYKQRKGPQPEDGDLPSSRYDDGKTGWRKMPIRSQDTLDRWVFDTGGGIKAMVQKPPPDYKDITIPIIKGLLFRTTTEKNNPEGQSILRGAYRPAYYKKRIEEVEGVGIERDLAGLPTGWIDPSYLDENAPEEKKAVLAAIQNILSNVRRDKQEYVIWPLAYDDKGNKVFDFTLQASAGTRTFDTDKIIQRYDQRITMTVLADFILLGHEKVGSFALSSDKTDMFAVAIAAWLDAIESVFNRFAVPRLFEMNNWKLEKLPEIKHGDIEPPPLADVAAYVTALVNAGVPMFPNKELEDHLMKIASLPEISDEVREEQERIKQEQQEQMMGELNPAEGDKEKGNQNAGGAGPGGNPQGTQPPPNRGGGAGVRRGR